uniref:Fibronectin type-III domain-containing protein n=1 Tax=Steinernema glaseri TaxID=37863 RepID=A0A1I7ZAV4_9BILA
MQVNNEDITIAWGQVPDQRDATFGRWRLAVFQDMQQSVDGSKLYFLYDPVSDDFCSTTGSRKGTTCLAVFDTYARCFVGEVPLRVRGRVKFLFCLPMRAPSGGSAFVLVTETEDYGQQQLHFWRVNLRADGMAVESEPAPLLREPLIVEDGFIVALREDMPEIVCITGPGLIVYRINADTPHQQSPTDRFEVPSANIDHFFDGFLSKGNVYFMSSTPDGHFDNSRIHVLSLTSRGPISTHFCQADPQRGMPPARKQAGIDSTAGFILVAGGEIDYGNGSVVRLTDYWVLDLSTFRWNQVPTPMPLPLIEPRLTTSNSGNVYVWGDFDQPLPGMPEAGTHLRILRVSGLNIVAPPSYNESSMYPQQPQSGGPQQPYPQQPGSQQPYPQQPGSQQPYSGYQDPYNQQKGPEQYPPQHPSEAPQYPQGGSQYPQGAPQYPQGAPQYPQGAPQGAPQYPQGAPEYPQGGQQYPHYPPQEKKKDCVIC